MFCFSIDTNINLHKCRKCRVKFITKSRLMKTHIEAVGHNNGVLLSEMANTFVHYGLKIVSLSVTGHPQTHFDGNDRTRQGVNPKRLHNAGMDISPKTSCLDNAS